MNDIQTSLAFIPSEYEHIFIRELTPDSADLTVIVPLYNYSRFVVNAFESLKIQTLQNFDLVVVDDCSTDNSCEVAREWLARNASRFNRTILVKHTCNQGLSATRNTAITLTQSLYIFPFDPDNELFSRCLEALHEAILNSKAGFVYCYLEHFGDNQLIGGLEPWNPKRLHEGNNIDAMVLHQRKILEEIHGYSVDMIYGWEDYDLWFKIARTGNWGIRLPEILARYRVHQSSMLAQHTNPNIEKIWIHLHQKYPEFFET